MNDVTIGTYSMQTNFGLYLPEYTIPAPPQQTKFVSIIGRDGAVDLSSALGIHYDSRKWTLDFKCFNPTVNWHTLISSVMNAIHGQRLNFEFADDPNYFWTGRINVESYKPNKGEGTVRVTITSDPFKYAKLSEIVQDTVPKGTSYSGDVATFTATSSNRITSLTVPFSPLQSLHGYANPWPAGGGKNLFDKDNPSVLNAYIDTTKIVSSSSHRTVYIPCAPNTTYTASKIAVAAGTSDRFAIAYTKELPANNVAVYGRSAKNSGFVIGEKVSLTTTTDSDAQYLVVWISRSTGTEYTDSLPTTQIEIGSIATDYAPYSNICPISGRTGLSVWDDPIYGGSIEWNQLVIDGNFTDASNWVAESSGKISTSVSGNILSVTLASTPTAMYHMGVKQKSGNDFNVVQGHKYLVGISAKVPRDTDYIILRSPALIGGSGQFNLISSLQANAWKRGYYIFTCAQTTNVRPYICPYAVGSYVANDVIQYKDYVFFDLTEMFGAGNEPYTVDDFRALFPNDYYAYNAGETTCVSAVNGDPYWKKTSDWTSVAGTVYGGSLDVVTGVLTSTMANIASYNGETITEPWLSSMDAYVSGATPTTGAQVVYTLATPLTYQLTPQEVSALVGTNNVWSEGDSVSVFLSSPIALNNTGGKSVIPTVTASAQMTLSWGSSSYTMQAGTSTIPALVLAPGTTNVYVDGTGTIKFEWSEASL